MNKKYNFQWDRHFFNFICSVSALNPLKVIAVPLAIITVIGCSNNRPPTLTSMKTNSIVIETAQAGNYLFDLNKLGHLPGIPANSHGDIISDIVPLQDTPSTALKTVLYPFSITYHVVIKGDPSTNNYIISKLSEGSTWQLKRAWKTDLNGQIIEEWSIK